MADVHIRLFQRHKEYREVFDELFDTINRIGTEDSVICILGDVVHSKTNISPEQMELLSYFLNGCGSLCKTLLIPGNHDFNESNPNRLDALTPVVDLLKCPNLWYERGNFALGLDDVTFSHFSIWGDKTKWKSVDEIPGTTKIAMYHGPVVGAISDTGYDRFSNAVPIDVFNGYDMVLLGDIHKRQFLNKEKTIAYPGSLIQQDYGESLNHGMIVWDVDSRRGEFCKIQNRYGFYTYHVKNGIVTNERPELPEFVRLRILYEDTDAATLQYIVDAVKDSSTVCDLVITDDTKTSIISATDGDADDLLQSRLPDKQIELIRRYYDGIGEVLSDSDIERMVSLNNDFNSKLNKDDGIVREVRWTPIRFTFSNMFSYGASNDIDFNALSGVIGLFAANASGKSSLLDSIVYCIFGKCSRTSRAVNVMNMNCDEFYCRFDFSIADVVYRVERIGSRGKNGLVSTVVNFYQVDGEQLTSLNGIRQDDTNRIIRKYIGSYDDFVMTTMSTQIDNRNFVEMGQKDRQEFLYRFLDIAVYGELYKIAKDESKELQQDVKRLESECYSDKVTDIESAKADAVIRRNDIEGEILNMRRMIAEVSERIESLVITAKSGHDATDINEIRHQLHERTSRLIVLERLIEAITDEIPNLEQLLSEFEDSIQKVDIAIDEEYAKQLSASIFKAQEMSRAIASLDNEISKLKVLADKLATHEYDPNCQYCMRNSFVIDATEAIRVLPDKQMEVNRLRATLEPVPELQKKLDSHLKKIEQYNFIVRDRDTLRRKIESAHAEIDRAKSEVSDVQYIIERLKSDVAEYEARRKEMESKMVIVEELIRERAHRSELELVMADLESERDKCIAELSRYEYQIDEINKKRKLLGEMHSKYRVYDLYQRAVNRDGVPYMILTTVLPLIESYVNSILTTIVDFKIRFKADDDDIDAFIVYGEREWPVELVSGMERFIMSLAIRSSLINLSILPKPNFLVIDEGFGVLDLDKMASVQGLLTHLKRDFGFVLCISHIMEMKDSVDKLIEIERNDGFSRILIT